MKNKFRLVTAPAVILCWCFIFFQGCKEPLIEDDNLLTPDDELNLAKDTLHVKVFSEFEEAFAAYGVSAGVLGTLTDPNFGNTYSSFYAQCRLTSNNVTFGANPVLDSAVLTLKYAGVYGKFDQPVTVSAYELTQSMDESSKYKTNDAFSVSVPPIGQVIGFTPNITDSVPTALQGSLAPHLRIPLTASFANKILTAGDSVLQDNTQFLNLFKGFYVTTSSSSTGNGLAYIDLTSLLTGITLYFHNDSIDSLRYTLPVSGGRVNHFDNIYTGTPVFTSANTPNPNGEEKMFIQAGAGVKGKILITDLDSLPKNIAINKAEIIFSQSASDTSYIAPLLLDLFRIDDSGQPQRIDDDGLSGFGGVRVSETVGGAAITRYRFNFKKYFQKLLQGVYKNNGFYLQSYAASLNSERVVISNSSSDQNYKVTLLITYTKL